MSARLTRSKAKERTEMSDTEAKLDVVLAKMDDDDDAILLKLESLEKKVKRKLLKMSAN